MRELAEIKANEHSTDEGVAYFAGVKDERRRNYHTVLRRARAFEEVADYGDENIRRGNESIARQMRELAREFAE